MNFDGLFVFIRGEGLAVDILQGGGGGLKQKWESPGLRSSEVKSIKETLMFWLHWSGKIYQSMFQCQVDIGDLKKQDFADIVVYIFTHWLTSLHIEGITI